MKWLLILLPISAYCYQVEYDLFSLSEGESEAFHHFENEVEAEVIFDETESLSLFEIDERDESLIPWSSDSFASSECDALSDAEAFEDVFTYEISYFGKSDQYKPTHEKVSEKRRLFRDCL